MHILPRRPSRIVAPTPLGVLIVTPLGIVAPLVALAPLMVIGLLFVVVSTPMSATATTSGRNAFELTSTKVVPMYNCPIATATSNAVFVLIFWYLKFIS